MIHVKSRLTAAFTLLLVALFPVTRLMASDLDDAQFHLDRAQAERAQAEADLQAAEAARAARLARDARDAAEFARFEAESRAPVRSTKVFEYKRIGPDGTRYIERHDYAPSDGGSYIERYESW